MSAETSGEVSHIQDEDVLRKMWQETEDFGKKKEIRSHMYKLREERLRNFYSSSSEAASEIQRAQSTPGLHDKPSKEGNGPTHADSLADHSFLSLKSKEIRDSESPTREMHYKVTDKSRGGDQGWNVVTKNESSPDGKTHTTSRLATTSGSQQIDGGVANYAAKCEQEASVYNDGDANNFTKAVSASSKNVIQQEAKGGDDHSKFQSFATSTSSSSKTVTQHHSSSGDTQNLKALPSNVDESSTIRKTYTTDVPEELRKNPNYIDGNTKVFTETRTLPDGTKVTTTRYATTKGGKTVTSSSTSSKQMTSEQKSSTVKSSSSKTESHSSSSRSIQEGRNTYNDSNRIVNQTGDTHIVRHVPDNFNDTELTVCVKVVKSADDNVDHSTISQNLSKTSSNTVNIQKSQKVIDSKNVDINTEHDRVIQTKEIRDTKTDAINQIRDTKHKIDVHQEQTTAKTNVIKTQKQDVRDTHQDDVRIIRLIQENEYLPRDTQPSLEQLPRDNQTTSTTTTSKQVVTTRGDTLKSQTTESVHDTVQDDVRITKTIQESGYTPRDKPPELTRVPKDQIPDVARQEVITTTKQIVTKTSESIPATPAASTPGDRTPVASTPGDRTPITSTPGNRTPAVQEIVCHLIRQERPDHLQQPDVKDSYSVKRTTTVTTHVDNRKDDKTMPDDFINKEPVHTKDYKPRQKEPTPTYETPERREPIKPGKSELDQKPSPTEGQYQTTYRTDYVNKRISVDVSPTHDAFARSLRAVSPDRDKKRGSTRSLKSSTSSLRSSTSPEKYPLDRRQPGRTSPDRKPLYDSRGSSPNKRPTPDKYISTETITKTTSVSPTRAICSPKQSPTKQRPNDVINTDTITRRRKDNEITSTHTITRTSPDRKPARQSTDGYHSTTTKTTRITSDDNRQSVIKSSDTNNIIDSSTLTRRSKGHPRSRSTSPTSVASDIEFVRSSEIITDLDADDSVTTATTKRTNISEFDDQSKIIQTQRTTIEKDVKDKRPVSLNVTHKKPKKITDRSPTSPLTDYSSPTRKSPTKDKPQDKPLKRRDTYEERCRQILGISDKTTTDRLVTEVNKTTKTRVDDTIRSIPKKMQGGYPRTPSKSPEKVRSPTKDIQEFPSQIRRSPEKQPLEKLPGKTRPSKESPKIQEFPSQIRRSPEKEPLQKPQEKRRPSKDAPKLQEFPSQTKRSPAKQPLEKPLEKSRTPSYQTKIQEFPAQIRRSPEKQPLEKYPEKVRPIKDRPTVDEYPSQVKKLPALGKAPGEADEPLFTKKFISTLCRDDEIQRSDVRQQSPERPISQTSRIPSLREPKQPSPERQHPPINKVFIDTERKDTDITITQYDEQPRRPSPDRRSPDRRTATTETYDVDKYRSKDVKEYNDEYSTSTRDEDRPLKPDRKSPVRFLDSELERHSKTTDVTEYTDEYETPDTNRSKPSKPDRRTPDRSALDTESVCRTKVSDITEYTNEYGRKIPSGVHHTKPKDREPERVSPGKISGITEYTDEYCSTTDKRQKITTDRVTKTTPTRKTPQTTTPDDDEEETTDSETESTTHMTKETAINGNMPKRTSPSKPVSKTDNKPKSEGPSQKPKPGKISTKVTKTTSTTLKDRKDGKISLYDIENTRGTEVDNKVHIRTHRIDDYYTTTKTSKPLTNGNVPKRTISPKRFELKLTKPAITEYPSQKTPDRKKPVGDKPTKPEQRRPIDRTPERKAPKRSEQPKTIYSPHDKPQSPERYSSSKQFIDNQRINTSQTVTRKITSKTITDTSDNKTRTKTPTKTIQRPDTQPKRHVVTTTIQVTPKTRPEGPKKSVERTTTTHSTSIKSKKLTQPKTTITTKTRKPFENGRITTEDSETDEEIVDEVVDTRRVSQNTYKVTRRTDAKITRTTSDQVIKTPYRTPVRGQSKPELLPSKTTQVTDSDKVTRKSDKKVITTKSIIINNDFDTDREIVVNLQRSKSSREPTPDRICPRPASEDEDTGIPRYPDHIMEPDEPSNRRKPTRICDLPIIESEDTAKFTRITEYGDHKKTTTTGREDRFEVDTNLRKSKSPSPTRKPSSIVDDTHRKDEVVTNKLKKFITTAERLTTEQYVIPERPKSPKCKNYPDINQDEEAFTSVSDKVSHFIETAAKIKSPQKPKEGPAPRIKRPDLTGVDETIKSDDCLLSVSDKVTKFSQKFESSDYKKPVSLAKIDIKQESPAREIPRRDSPGRSSPRRESPLRESPLRESPRREIHQYSPPKRFSPSRITTECVQIDTEDQTYTRRLSPDRYSPVRRGSSPKPYSDDKTPHRPSTLTRTDTTENRYKQKNTSIKDLDSTPKSSRKDEEPKSVLSPTGRLRSTESIRKAKELFENIAKEQKTTKQRDIISRPSVFQGRKPKQPDYDDITTRRTTSEDVKLTDIGVYNLKTTGSKTRNACTKLKYSSDEELDVTDTTRKTTVSSYNKDTDLKSTRLILEKLNKHAPDDDTDSPGYLRPLDRSPRPHSPYYDRSRSPKAHSQSPSRERSPRPHDPSLDEIPHYMWPLDRSIHDHPDHERSHSPRSREQTPDRHSKISSRGSSPDPNVPSYMKPLDRHVRGKSPYRKGDTEHDAPKRKPSRDDTGKPNKFGVTLRRTDSGKAITATTTTKSTSATSTSQRRKLSTIEIERILTTQEIEEIYDLEILEVLLERAVSYEQRRRVRSQIRIVKQLISENRLTSVISKKTSKTVSPTRDSKSRGTSPDKPLKTGRKSSDRSVTEYQTEYVRKVSPTRKPVENKLYQHTDIVSKRSDVARKTEYQSSYAYSERRTSSEVKTHVRESSPQTKVIRASPEKTPRKSIEKIVRHSPERRTEKTEARSVFKTELKRTTPSTKTVVEERPSWVTQRTLKNTADVVPSRKTSSTTTSSTTKKQQTISRTSPSKERKPIDDITSSYGVGPTDENGSPLFGLKALRAQNRTDTTKVQGTVIRSHYYAENGQEPTGEISVTKYSTDPRDLDGNVEERNGLVSVTTTQKFGTKGAPSYKTAIDKKKICDLNDDETKTLTKKTTTSKVSRRGSVKEMSQKFINNAVETSKNERQSSYPKAGLILRTSSFKDTAVSGSTKSSRESSPEKHSTITTTTVKKTTSSSSSGGRSDTFLNNKTRVSGVQDVITRMKNADDDVHIGDSPGDAEARSLLNKFIGSQVILSGMETRSSSTAPSSTTTVRRTTTATTTTSKGGGKPTVITRTFTHPITEDELRTVWDEQTLKLLLERSTDYEERQIIRGRIRDVMAEQEVCSDIVAKSKEESSGRIEGESLLLPLLQGLLDAPDNEQTADSGTESGEDLRSGLIIEVQNVLSKLANSLKSDSNDMTTDRRSSLLQLVTRLQTGLAVQPPSTSERRGSGPNRFARRKRQNRHTVGVSSEELEDARKLMEEIRLCDPLNSGSSTPLRAPQQPLQKQNSEGSVLQRTSEFRAVTANQNKSAVKNAVAKPYGSSASTSQSHSGTSSTVDTPTEASDALEFPSARLEAKPGEAMTYHDPPQVQTREKKSQYAVLQHSASLENKKTDHKQKPPATVSSNFSPEIEKKSVTNKPAQYVTNPLSQIQIENSGSTQESETDEDPVTIKGKQTPVAIAVQPQLEEQKLFHNPVQQYESKTNMVLQSNPIYSKPKSPEPEDPKLNNKFNNKKLKMKRANTIDIPKPLDFYESEDDYDSDTSLVDRQNRRSNYLALRGPIRVGKNNGSNTNVPVFEPKTDSDRKFLAFINKHSDDNNNKGSLWAGQAQPTSKHGPNWNNRFGHIRTAFEKASTSTPSTPNTNVSSARNFWKSADDAVSAGKPSYNGPKVSKQGARDLRQMFEERDRQVQQKSPYSSSDEKNIVTGTLKVDTKGFDAKKNYKLVSQPQPQPVNKFSHAPTSAFAAIPKKNGPQVVPVTQTTPSSKNVIQAPPSSINEPIKQPGKVVVPENIVKSDYKESDSNNPTPLYLYSPKPLQTSPQSVSSTSPSSTPWANSTNEHRVQKLAASKFESPVAKDPPIIKPRRLSKDKTFSPSAFQQPPPDEKLTAPYLVKSADKASTVRKLSDQFNSKTSKAPEAYSTFTTVKYRPTSPNNQNLSSYQPQNYSITYANKKHQSYPPKQIDNEYHHEPPKTYSQPQTQSYHKYQPEQPQNYSHQPNKQSYQKYSNEDPQKYSQSTPIYQAQHQSRSNSMKVKSSDTNSHSYSNQPQSSSFKYKQPQQLPTNDTKSYEYSSKPQNYSVQYNQPHKVPTIETKPQDYQPKNYSVQYNQPQNLHTTPKVYQAQTQTQPQEYTSQQFIQFNQPKPTQETKKYPSPQVKQKQDSIKIYDVSSPDSSPTPQPQYKRQTSQESVKEYQAAVTRVMKGPISHQAVTVQQKGPKGRDEHDMEAAFNLKSVLQKFSQPDKPIQDNTRPKKIASNHTHSDNIERKLSIDSAVIAQNKSTKAAAASTNLQRTQSFKKPNAGQIAPDFLVNGKPLSMESTEINEDGESIITSKFHIPVVTVNTKPQVSKPVPKQEPPKIISPTKNMLSKSDSWHQLMHEQQQMQQKPSPRSSPNFKPVGRSKSSHTLAVPTIQFQAGMTKDEVAQKKRTVEAYFSGKLSPQSLSKSPSDESLDKSDKVEVKASKTTINRKKTSEKVSIHKHTGVVRSRTLPSIMCPNLLDEKKVETTKRTFTEGPVTTTEVTRVTSQQGAKKPMSPFAKFRQLDKQNSLNTPPGTPRTPTGSRPLFKFTDPEVGRQASTVKDRLLQWCQMKTKEYENVQLDNFSSSWADGLAFCALIHHFLPDAFDYHALTPKERRHNFTLAFRVADEKADILPLLDVDDMVATRKPDWKCVFTYVQTIYSRFRNED